MQNESFCALAHLPDFFIKPVALTRKFVMNIENEIKPLKEILNILRKEGKVLVAILYGSYSSGTPHVRSDIDLAVFVNTCNEVDEVEIIDKILMSTERDIALLRLDDEEESPFVVQEALKGKHLVTPDDDALYKVAHRVLHETEELRFRRSFHA